MARRLKLNKPQDLAKAKCIASFFNRIINGEVPAKLQKFLRQTYLVALEKDPNDKTKLRPLGVPAAMRRIAAVLVLSEYRSSFAEHILPFNFAIGIGGGVDVIVKTVQLAIDKYMIGPEKKKAFPTRSLVSLDIRNMFNAVSRERLREIIAEKFPSLEAFADLIYDDFGETIVRLEDGTWTSIPVEEGFSQGCPASPVFAAIVLNEILSKIYGELEERAKQRLKDGDKGDDNLGSLGILLAYVDDVNAVLCHDDVDYFLKRFVEEATPKGAILNTEKTRIMTSTNGTPLTDKLLATGTLKQMMLGQRLKTAISNYSTEIIDGTRKPVEVTDGLRVLGAPVGSTSFCQNFLSKALNRAKTDAKLLLKNLEDLQTILRIYSTCTAHKITHLFSSDVYNTAVEELPNNYYLWDSPLTQDFSQMTENVLTNITNSHTLPLYSQVIANMSIAQGGLGLQSPRANAITAHMTTAKRCLQYIHEGVWLGHNMTRPLLPDSINLLYSDWQTSDDRSWRIFRKYIKDFNQIATGGKPQNDSDFIFKCSLNGTREKAKELASQKIRTEVLESEFITPKHVQD